VFLQTSNCQKWTLIQLVALLFSVTFSSASYSQGNLRLMGQVLDDENGFPIANAAVIVKDTPYGAYTDEDGFFAIENIPMGSYTITVTMLGYKKAAVENVLIKEDIANNLVTELHQLKLETDPLQVIASQDVNSFDIEGEKVIITGDELDRYRALGLPQILQQIAGLQVESTGSGATMSSIRIHGGRSSGVLVFLDGQRLNNPQTGEVDLSQIPIDNIERIEVIRQGNSAIFGGSAFDGVVSFQTRIVPDENQVYIRGQAGSFETTMANLTASTNVFSIAVLFSYQKDYSRQNFDYYYEGQQYQRENASYQNNHYFGKLNWAKDRYDGNFLFNFRKGERGLPCPFFNECGTVDTEMREKTQTLQLQQRFYISSKFITELLAGYTSLFQQYNNENDPVVFTRYKTEQTNSNLDIKLQGSYSSKIFSEIRGGFHYLKEKMDQENILYPQSSIGKQERQARSVFGAISLPFNKNNILWQSAKLNNAIRYEKYFDQPWQWYPTVGLNLVPSLFSTFTLSGSWYKSVRYPDFNSLFWKGDSRARGNPELLPERKTGWNIGLRFQSENPYYPQLNTVFYSEKLNDLIYWHRSFNGVWEPRNEDAAEKQGIDFEMRQELIRDHISFQGGYSHINAINKTDEVNRYDNRIVFIPENVVNASLWLGIASFSGQLIYRFVDERETVFANSQGTQLGSYQIFDLALSCLTHFGKLNWEFGFAVKNITETSYQLLHGYPMPGREFQLSLILKSNP
jgi:outer membrane receptor for ferrienterochelin and colicins